MSEQGAARRALIERLWAEGLTVREIGEQLGWSPSSIRSGVSKLRKLGYDLPHRGPPEPVAGITHATAEGFARHG